jgi:LuxR family transcriptional regulator, maltose regulon positive regulatory protein
MATTDPIQKGLAALTAASWDEARKAFETALAAEETAQALEGLGMAAWWLDDAATVFSSRERAYALYRQQKDVRAAARVAIALAEDSLYFRGEPAVARGWHRRASRLLEGQDAIAEHAWLKVSRGDFALVVDRDFSTARQFAAEAATLARSIDDLDAEMVGLALEGLTLVFNGEAEEGMARLDEAATAALAGEISDKGAAGVCCCYLMRACETVRDLDRAAQWCARVKEFSARVGFASLFGICRGHYGAILILNGSWKEAERELEGAIAQLATSRPPLEPEPLVWLAELRRRQGRFDEARALLDRTAGEPSALLVRAALAIDEGDARSAVRLAERFLASVPEESQATTLAARELLLRARLMRGETDAARSLATNIEAAAGRIGTVAARAMGRLALGMTAAREGKLDEARHALEDAADLFGRATMPFEQAAARLELASVLMTAGERDAAGREAQNALETFERLEAKHEVARAKSMLAGLSPGSTRRPAGSLTSRELEVLQLLADGSTNSQIAARLFVSEFTIKRHVANILKKLDLPSRAAAAAHAVRDGLH